MVEQIFIMKQNTENMKRDDWILLVNLKAKELKATRIDYILPLFFSARAVIHYEVEK